MKYLVYATNEKKKPAEPNRSSDSLLSAYRDLLNEGLYLKILGMVDIASEIDVCRS